MGDGASQREGVHSTEPKRIGSMMAVPSEVTEESCLVLLASFSSLYGLIPGVWHFLYKSSWSLFSSGGEAYKMAFKNYIAF